MMLHDVREIARLIMCRLGQEDSKQCTLDP